jgi:hypothetical protein
LRRFSTAKKTTPMVLAASILAFQVAIPWTVPHLITDDGPSHIYTSVVARNLLGNLLLNRKSHYGEIYHFNSKITPNLGGFILLGTFVSIAGVNQAEKLMMSFSLVVGFLSIGYAIWSLSPEWIPWTPLINVLLQVWFLWRGYYDFYLGMVLCPLVVGYFLHNIHRLTVRRAAVVGVGLCGIFLTHVLAAALAGLVLGVVGTWVYWIVPATAKHNEPGRSYFPASLRQLGLLFAVLLPTLALFLLFAASSSESVHWHPEIAWAFNSFPMHSFVTASGRSGSQTFIWPVLLCLIALSLGAMRGSEWKSAKGGLACAVILIFLAYLIVPEQGLGGSQTKVRFSWAVFLWGGILACSVRKLRLIQVPLAVYFSVFLIGTLWSTKTALAASSRAVEDYLSLAGQIRPGSRLVRLRYPTMDLPRQYGFEDTGRDPLLHVDAFIAARCKCIDLSDYQAPSGVFPVVFNPGVIKAQQIGLWQLEGPGPETSATVAWLRTTLPVPIDYTIIVSDDHAQEASNSDYSRLLANLNAGMRLVAVSRSRPFAKLYERTGAR